MLKGGILNMVQVFNKVAASAQLAQLFVANKHSESSYKGCNTVHENGQKVGSPFTSFYNQFTKLT